MFVTIKNIFLGLVKKLKPKKPANIIASIGEDKKMDTNFVDWFEPVKKDNNKKILELSKFKSELDVILSSKHRNQ